MTQPTGGGRMSLFLRKTGPLPNWVWAALLLLLAIIYAIWQRNKSQVAADETGAEVVDELPGDQTPPPVFIIPQAPQPTVPITINVPPGTTPAPSPPAAGRPPAIKPVPPGKPTAPVKPAVSYHTVKVVKYTSKNPPWNSTLWGIAKHFGYGSAGKNWTSIWDDPRNATLKKKRGQPEKIQPGDVIYVRAK